MDSRSVKIASLCLIAFILLVFIWNFPPIAQPENYHDFADKRAFFGLNHAFDVLSNLPIFFVGIWGIYFLKKTNLQSTSTFEKNLWFVFFGATAFVAIFSFYYHLAPDNFRLFWDRIGLSVLFLSFFSLMLEERINHKIGVRLAIPLIIFGVGSVFYWILTEKAGAGDLRFYVLTQFGPIIVLPFLFFLFPSKHPGQYWIYGSLGFYILAKFAEEWDAQIFHFFHENLAGHTLKHLLSSISLVFIVLYLKKRAIKIKK